MKFLEQEPEIKRIQLMQYLSLASAEEDAMKRILEEDKIRVENRNQIAKMKGKKIVAMTFISHQN